MNTTHRIIDAIGIDIGYHQTKFTLGRGPDKVLLLDKFPSHAVRLEQKVLPDVGGPRPDGVVVTSCGQFYFVGPSVFDVVNTPRIHHIDPDFTATPEYLAFYEGALHRIVAAAGDDGGNTQSLSVVIKHMCMGLPVDSLGDKRDRVVELAAGKHTVRGRDGNGEVQVIVENVHVLAQPQGAILAEDIKLLMPDVKGKTHTTLVIDIGGGTFDWLVTTGLQLRPTRSGSCPIGTYACLEAAAAALNPALKRDPFAIAALDHAMRLDEEQVQIGPKSYSMGPCWEAARPVMKKAIEEMIHKVQLWGDIAHVLVTGGGASMFYDAIQGELRDYSEAFRAAKEPVTANVRGFHMYSENMAARPRVNAL